MKINELSFKNHANGWELEKTTFGNLTLLVGASGVGKTQILKAINTLVKISKGESFPGVQWDTAMTMDNGSQYRWTGRFDIPGKDLESKSKAPLISETLVADDKLVFERKGSDTRFEGNTIPKISPYSSVLDIFTEEEAIIPIKTAFKRVTLFDYSKEKVILSSLSAKSDVSTISSIVRTSELSHTKSKEVVHKMTMFLKEFNFPILLKLLVIEKLDNKLFNGIIGDFQEVFPQIEDVRFQFQKEHDAYMLQIREKGTSWIPMRDISSGMFKTLLHIAELKLMADGHVILIDEFENSLGVNCIDTVSANLLAPGRNIQYIITSHHPYIINNIDMKYWKVVTRKGSKVSTMDVKQLKLGKSKHEAFKQLLNLEVFTEGIS